MLGPIMLDISGVALNQEDKEMIQNPLVGGVILFTRNYQTRDQLQKLILDIRKQRDPILIAVDHEGGRVQRFREEFTPLPPLADFGKLYKQNPAAATSQAEKMAYIMASELLEVGIDFSFAPVLDVDRGISQVIGTRSFNDDPQVVCILGDAYLRGMEKAGMAAVGKHFPGHGAVHADSHYELPVDDREFSEIYETDLQPFIALHPRLKAIMPAHVVYTKIDQDPAGFSKYWLKRILRDELKYQGAIISDDLSMNGASIKGGYLQRAMAALAAGCDMITVCNHRKGAMEILNGLSSDDIKTASQQRLLAMRG